MTAPTMPVLLCASDGCAGKRCGRDRHAYLGGGPSGREPQYGRCQTHGRCVRFELDELATLDVQARPVEGGDGLVEAVSTPAVAGSGRPAGPGLDAAPAPGAEAAAPPADGQPAAEVDGPAPAAGQLLHQGRTWWCPTCLQGRELPSKRCCKTPLIEADTIIRRRVANG